MSRSPDSEIAAPSPRVHERWPGNETFACDGRCVAGPRPRAALCTAALIAAPSLVNLLVVIEPLLRRKLGAWTLACGVALPAWCLGWLAKTALTDPGILPRLARDGRTSSMRGKTRETTVATTGRTTTTRWNDTCGYFQPPRAHHCSVCNDCVEKFDHHCPWTGTTIGKRNYRAFLMFTYGTTALCAFTMTTCGYSVSYRGLKKSGAAIAVFFVAFVAFVFVGALSCFHAYLVSTNQTTYENFRDAHGWRANPYNTGSVLKNCYEVWFAKIGPPRVRFDARVSEDESAKTFAREIAESDEAAARAAAAARDSAVEAGVAGRESDVELPVIASPTSPRSSS